VNALALKMSTNSLHHRLATRPGASRFVGDCLVARETAAGVGVVEAPEERLQDVQEGARVIGPFMLPWPSMAGTPGSLMGGRRGFESLRPFHVIRERRGLIDVATTGQSR
jgi:hypothetical protein